MAALLRKPKSAKSEVVRTLQELQNLVKRDPDGYRQEFEQQLRHYDSSLAIFKLAPSEESKGFGELVTFIAAVAHKFPDHVKTFPTEVKDLLSEHSLILDAGLRQTLCRALMLLRNKDMLTAFSLLELFFKLFRCPDKHLRGLLYKHILNDIRKMNLKAKQNQLNRQLQNFMYKMLADSHIIAAKKSLDLMVALYRKRIWTDAKTVNVLASALFSDSSKLKVTALKFFLSSDAMEEEDESDDEDPNAGKTYDEMLRNQATRKTKKRQNLMKKQLAREKKKAKGKTRAEVYDFAALHLLHDPQGLCEKMFKDLKGSKERWEVQLMQMNLISRLVSIHELILLNFYPYLERYLWPTKPDVTQVLAYVAQACHEYVPPDALESVLLKIAYNFVSERSAPPVMAVGLNSIREICVRCPLAMNETLLRDLVQYKKYKDKGVMIAAKGLIGAFRELNPEMLHKKDRGKPGEDEGLEDGGALQYGAQEAATFVPGVELLSMYHEMQQQQQGGGGGNEGGAAAPYESDGEEEFSLGPTKHKATKEVVVDWDSDDAKGDDSDDEDGGWIDVKDTPGLLEGFDAGSDGDNDDEKVVDELTKEERVKRAQVITQTKLLTQADFERIKMLQMERKLMPAGGQKRQRLQEQMRDERLDHDDILPIVKKARQNKEERVASIHAGREDRGKFNIRKGHEGGTTNTQKSKKKNPFMIKQKKGYSASAKYNKKRTEAKAMKKRFRGKKKK